MYDCRKCRGIKGMPWWYPIEYSGIDEMRIGMYERKVLYGYEKYGLAHEEAENLMGFGGEFLDDTDFDSCTEDRYIDANRLEYREAYWRYMAENDSEFFSF